MSVFFIATGIAAILLVLISATSLGLAAAVQAYLSQHYNDRFALTGAIKASYYTPGPYTVIRGNSLELATGALGVVVGAVILLFMVKPNGFGVAITGRKDPRRITWIPATITLSALLAMLALATLVVIFYDNHHYAGSGRYLTACAYLRTDSSYCYTDTIPHSTMEGYTCKLYNLQGYFASQSVAHLLQRTCAVSKTARWLTIPLFIFPVFVILFALLEVRKNNMQRRQLTATERQASPSSDTTAVPAPTYTASAGTYAKESYEVPFSPVSEVEGVDQKFEMSNKEKLELESGPKIIQRPGQRLEMPA